jgi:polysaccharide biosynthesis protein PslH
MDILFLSHCVPNPPDKGEKIRAHHELIHLAARYSVHLVCFAKSPIEEEDAAKLKSICASVYVERLVPARSLALAAAEFAAGRCLMTSYYGSRRMRQHVETIASRGLDACVAYSSAMAQYAPANVPLILDMVDVDSEKWFQYGRMRRPGMLYRIEGGRLRRLETAYGQRSAATFLSTWNEAGLFRSFSPNCEIDCMENGVDFDFFNASEVSAPASLNGRPYVAFVGAMDYYPNADAVCWFAANVFPELRRRRRHLEFLIVGRDPGKAVRRLAEQPGITVTGSVPDVRPYLVGAISVVAPLRVARGIQNKVLEALAMGKGVFASEAVCRTFGQSLPAGLVRCDSEADYLRILNKGEGIAYPPPEIIREEARKRFSWSNNLKGLADRLDGVLYGPPGLELRLH